MNANYFASRLESGKQYLAGEPRAGIATHEHVKCSKSFLGPGMDRNVAFGKHQHSADSTSISTLMEKDVENRRIGGNSCLNERVANPGQTFKASATPMINHKLLAGISQLAFLNEVIRLYFLF